VLVVTAALVAVIAKHQLDVHNALLHFRGTVIHYNPSTEQKQISSNGTLVLSGSMQSIATFTMTGALSVGHVQNLSWDLPLQSSLAVNGYSLHVDPPSYSFNVPPDSHVDAIDDGNAVRRFHWDSPPKNAAINVVETLHVSAQSALRPLSVDPAFPLTTTSPDAAAYLAVTPALKLPARATKFVHSLAAGKSTERLVVEAVANWVATHVAYSSGRSTKPFFLARWVYNHKSANCRGYDNLMAGMLRSLNIPSRTIDGWVTSPRLNLPGPLGATSFVQWSQPNSSGELHTWLEIYFPGAGWVPFDPQREKYFVDPRHFAFYTNVDAGDHYIGAWSAYPVGGDPAIGPRLSDGSTEIVPGDGVSSRVTTVTHDFANINSSGFRHDVTTLLLLSR
jgi:hypothetical protein